MRASFLGVILLLAAAVCRAADVPSNAAEVYRQAFTAMPKLTAEEQKLLAGQSSSADAAALSSKLAPALQLYRSAARMESCDWGLDLEKQSISFQTLLPHLGPLNALANAAAWEAGRVKNSDPTAFVAWHEDALRSAVHAGEGWPVVSGLIEAAMRQRSLDALSTNLAALPPNLLAQLGERLGAIPPCVDFQKALQDEKAFGIDWFMRRMVEVHREWKAAEAATNFAARLRMSAMASGGPIGLKVGLEENGGGSFWLGLGQRKHGIELVSADLRRGEAILVKDGQAALIFLQEKRIEPIRLQLINDELKRLLGDKDAQRIIGSVGTNSTRLVQQLMDASDIMGALAASAATPVKDPEAWGRSMAAEVTNRNAIVGMYFPLLGGIRATMDATRAKELMLQTALDVVREGPAAAARSRDPWGEGPFTCRQTADGYEIVSQLQRNGQSVTLRVPRR